MMLLCFVLLTVLLVLLPFIPCFLEALWGKDNKPTPITDHQLIDLRDDPERIWNLVDLNPPKHFKRIETEPLMREHIETLYCPHHISLNHTERLWELHVRGDLHVQSSLTVAWWLTARNLIIAAEVEAVGKIQAVENLKILSSMQFHQLQAGLVDIGDTGSLLRYQFEPPSVRTRQVLHGAWSVPVHTEMYGDFIIHGNVVLEEGSVLHGSLKVWGSLILKAGAQISGNVFVTRCATLESGTAVGGVVVVEEKLLCCGGNVFGSVIQPAMVVAETMTITGGVRVYGTLKAWQRGEINIDKHLHVHSSHPIEQTGIQSD